MDEKFRVLSYAFAKNSGLILNYCVADFDIPQETWDAFSEKYPEYVFKVPAKNFTSEMIDKCITHGCFSRVPEHLITEEICSKAVEQGVSLTRIPEKFLTDSLLKKNEKNLVESLQKNSDLWKKGSPEFMIEIAKKYNREFRISSLPKSFLPHILSVEGRHLYSIDSYRRTPDMLKIAYKNTKVALLFMNDEEKKIALQSEAESEAESEG